MGNITASFTFSPNLQIATEAVTFTGVAETDIEEGTIDKWEWKFGNGAIIEGTQVQSNTFLNPGNYNVWMRVTDSENVQETIGPIVVRITKKYRVTLAWAKKDVRIRVTTTEYEAGNRVVGVVSRSVEQGVQNIEDQYGKCAGRIWDEITDEDELPSAAEIKAGIEAALHELVKESVE